MGIFNRSYELSRKQGWLLDEIDAFFRKKLGKKKHAIRYAIVEVRENKIRLEASIEE